MRHKSEPLRRSHTFTMSFALVAAMLLVVAMLIAGLASADSGPGAMTIWALATPMPLRALPARSSKRSWSGSWRNKAFSVPGHVGDPNEGVTLMTNVEGETVHQGVTCSPNARVREYKVWGLP